MTVDLQQLMPILGVFTIIAGAVMGLDHIIRDDHKARLFHYFVSVAQFGSRPFTRTFYIVIVLWSLVLTYSVSRIDARLRLLTGDVSELPTLLETVALILLPLFFKIFAWDYVLALKTFGLIKILSSEAETKSRRRPRKLMATAPGVIFIVLDFAVTIMLTHLTMSWCEEIQSQFVQSVVDADERQREPAPRKPELPAPPEGPVIEDERTEDSSKLPTDELEADATVAPQPTPQPPKQPERHSFLWRVAEKLGIFDAIDFVAKDTLKASLYVLNGTPMMYLFALLSAAAKGTLKHLNVEGISKNLFSLIGRYGLVAVLVVSVVVTIARQWVEKG